jgi:hypothetical protein
MVVKMTRHEPINPPLRILAGVGEPKLRPVLLKNNDVLPVMAGALSYATGE